MSRRNSNDRAGNGRGREMTCRELVEVITAYLEGAMPAADRRRFQAHLETCPWCVNYLEQMRGTIEAMGTLSEDSLSAETQQRLVEAFRDWRGR